MQRLEIARDANMRVDFVLLDHHWLFRGIRHTLADPVTGDLLEARLPEGRARILLTQEGHDALFDRVIEPIHPALRRRRHRARTCAIRSSRSSS